MPQADRDRRDVPRPPQRRGGGGACPDRPVFVIQEHAASSRHFDLRLEVDGALASWAVPRGPSTDPRETRLAVRTEDHPLDHADFEGRIPEGDYGAGRVIVWDAGTWETITHKEEGVRPAAKALEEGHLLAWLEGRKLRGGYALQRMGEGADAAWRRVKMKDEGADARRNPVSTEPESVISGKTVEEIGEEDA